MCKYNSEYLDHEMNKHLLFKCNETIVKDGFCIFHHPDYWKDNSEEIVTKFYEKVESAIKKKKKLLCIGYNLPEIKLTKYFKDLPITVYFNSSKFHQTTDFSHVTFNARAYFIRTRFKEANFHFARFNELANFSEATFNARAYFRWATFKERVAFIHTRFKERADFSNATFKETNFSFARFKEQANFSDATFNARAYFNRTRFKEANFSEATFNARAYFRWATFNARADFSNATFKEQANFVGLKKVQENSKLGDDPILFFKAVNFVDSKKIVFDDVDLSNTSFVYTDVSQINIGDRVRWDANKKLLDERYADEGKVPYEKAATVFRRIRQNLESKLRYVEAGRFFIAEMDIRRKNVKPKNRVLRWLRVNVFSALAWYRYFSNYGESYWRTLLWIPIILIIPTFYTTLTTTPADFLIHLDDYIFAFFQLRTENIEELITRILSLLIMGQLYISLRRKFERRYSK